MKKCPNISFIGGILALVCYVFFTLLAFFKYPLSYSPIRNWLSDLGNVDLNPDGASYYNIGIITTALFLTAFFLGLSRWKIEKMRFQIIMLLLAQFFGILGSLSMIMSAIFPINQLEVHRFWSISLYFMLATAFVFSAAALRYYQIIPRWLLILGVLPAVMVNITNFFPTVYILEWITISLFLGYVGLVGFNTKGL